MNIQEILLIIRLNIKNIVIFLGIYFAISITMCFIYSVCIRKLALYDALKDCVKFFQLLLTFNYPILELYSFSSIKRLLARVFVPISKLNMFWTDVTHIKLKNAEYKSEKGAIELTELILTRDQIEIPYNIISKKDNFDLVKDKNKNSFIINNKKYDCYIDAEQKKIRINCSGYYIFNDSKVVFEGKFKYDKNIFRIEISTSDFFAYGEQYDVKSLIDICSFLCQLCFSICCLITFFICVCVNIKIVFSVLLINFLVFRGVSGLIRRLFDVFSEMKCKE